MDSNLFFASKRTYRRFRQEHVEDIYIEEILESARLSSCGGNKQGLKFAVVRGNMAKELNKLVKWAAYLPASEGTPKEDEVPDFFIVVLKDSELPAASDTDVGIAVSNMTTSAWMNKIGSCIMGAIDRDGINALLGLGERYTISLAVAFGYPAHKSSVAEMKDGNIRYSLDENRDFVVPKRKLEDITMYFN